MWESIPRARFAPGLGLVFPWVRGASTRNQG